VAFVAAVMSAVPLATALPARAHPLGNFTVNAYSGITVTPGRLRVDYVLDLAEIPTFQERSRLDADGDDLIEPEERAAWASRRAEEILSALSVEVNGRPVSLANQGSSAELLPGQGGLEILRMEASFGAPVPSDGRLRFRDGNAPDRVGWREISVSGAEGIAVTESSVPAISISQQLSAYPEDLLSSPLQVREASFSFHPGQERPAPGPLAAGNDASRPGASDGPLAGLVAAPSLSLGVVLLSLLAAFGVGAVHALAPGHGKTITAAYLAGSSGGIRHAVGAGAAVSLMHTVSVVALGLVVLLAGRAVPSERVYPWLGLAAGTTALVLGGALLLRHLRSRSGHQHPHAHPHGPLTRRGLAALAMSGGLLPSPTAVVVLLAAFSLGRVAFGLGLIAAFGVGLAAALATIGMVAVRARDLVTQRSWPRMAAALPLVSAAAILTVGLLVTARAVGQL
jgi:ABC-type nickel/cobalt efflux system permease component RcnA